MPNPRAHRRRLHLLARRLPDEHPKCRAMADSSDADHESSSPERGHLWLFAGEVAEEAVEAIDVEGLRAGDPLEAAVDAERIGAALGRPLGRALAQRAVGDAVDEYAGRLEREVAGRVGARDCRAALERADLEVLPDSLAGSSHLAPGKSPQSGED